MLRLMYRFYDTDSGVLRVCGSDVRDISMSSLRSNLGVVPQDVVLFHNTLRYNLLYGKPDASEAELEVGKQRFFVG